MERRSASASSAPRRAIARSISGNLPFRKEFEVSSPSTKDTEKHMTHVIELSELKSHGQQGSAVLAGNLNVLHSVKVRLRVSVGQATLTIGELLGLKEGG